MTNETHVIETIEQFFKVANNENINRLMNDFILYSEYCLEMTSKYPSLRVTAFEWTDDGINEITGFKLNDISYDQSKQSPTS